MILILENFEGSNVVHEKIELKNNLSIIVGNQKHTIEISDNSDGGGIKIRSRTSGKQLAVIPHANNMIAIKEEDYD